MLDELNAKVFPATDWRDPTFDKWIQRLARPIVFTNGCFDLLHRGHVTYLARSAGLGASLIVALNDDASVRAQNKGVERPLNLLDDRMAVLAGLQCVDAVVGFSEPTPLEIINVLRPEVLVKGGDWTIENIVGAKEVQSWGGEVHSIAFEFQRSTTDLVNKIKGAV